VTLLGSDDSTKKKGGEEEIVLDFSQLSTTEDTNEIDTGVTSGADPSEWDPIDIDAEGRVDTCDNSDGKQAAAVCKSSQQNQEQPAQPQHQRY
jgi:hypothetical protein